MAFIQTVERASTRYRVRWYEAGVRRLGMLLRWLDGGLS